MFRARPCRALCTRAAPWRSVPNTAGSVPRHQRAMPCRAVPSRGRIRPCRAVPGEYYGVPCRAVPCQITTARHAKPCQEITTAIRHQRRHPC